MDSCPGMFGLEQILINKFWKDIVLLLIKNWHKKKEIYNELYTTFSKLKLSKFYKATSNTIHSDMIITKKSFDTMIKAAMLRKHVNELKGIQDGIHIEVDHDVEKSLTTYDIHN